MQRVIQRMQKKDPYRIFAEVPSEEMVRPLPSISAPRPEDSYPSVHHAFQLCCALMSAILTGASCGYLALHMGCADASGRAISRVPRHEGILVMQAPGYTKIVTRPMAFSIMWERFRKGEYMTWEELQADLDQMFRNAMTYNRPETVFHKQASMLGFPSASVLTNFSS